MGEQTQNQFEWQNPANWRGPRWLGIYFSKQDTRLWVPKAIPAWGWTINLGHRHGPAWLIGIILGIVVLILAVSVAIAL